MGSASQRLYREAMERADEEPSVAGRLTLRRLEQQRPEDAEALAELEAFKERLLDRTVDAMLAELGPDHTDEQRQAWLKAFAERSRRKMEWVQEQQRRQRDGLPPTPPPPGVSFD